MKGIYVCGTDTGVGKTVLSALLMRYLKYKKKKAKYLKPIQTGFESDTLTVKNLAHLSEDEIETPIVSLPKPASIDQASKDADFRLEKRKVFQGIKKVANQYTEATWILEAAGGLRVPLNEEQDQADLIEKIDLPVILATRSGLGTLNHTLLTAEALERRNITLKGVIMFGEPHPENMVSLSQHLKSVPILDFPWFKELTSDALDLALGVHDFENLMQ